MAKQIGASKAKILARPVAMVYKTPWQNSSISRDLRGETRASEEVSSKATIQRQPGLSIQKIQYI
jgi:hypothetical protein